ncbi:hypothetical protein [Mucilaginibacter sp. L196]|uniref:hypothetical protein n=1 Tax=Mucilaginibacter sp. L196 TaxID=1641870 RepID=UPI00131DDBD2|nr:hypothetical protein [Mucilaginibacter sp. L196]
MDNPVTEDFSPEINYEKSIQKHRLIYKITGGRVFSEAANWLMFSLFIFISLQPLLFGRTPSTGVVILITLFISWMLSNALLNYSLVKIPGTTINENRAAIRLAINKFVTVKDFKVDNDVMMRSFKPTGHPFWGKIVTILFDGTEMYLNITSTGKSENPTMIHGLRNYIKAKRIARYYKSNFIDIKH